MRSLLLALVFVVIVIAVSGNICPRCSRGYTDDSTCTCSGRRLKDNCAGAGKGIGAVTCLVEQFCCYKPKKKPCSCHLKAKAKAVAGQS
ncbi:CLUMA_CG013060, isoform A [Clunio marinus]|uniref:CLUMA_CG013060, isoform A n=1 Tax=Clunio marinus TaxID=568069 RepID=A0A1J1IHM8_9DIPT|nr:CLUMA_CG013060, isoform A [Clunio marinus]